MQRVFVLRDQTTQDIICCTLKIFLVYQFTSEIKSEQILSNIRLNTDVCSITHCNTLIKSYFPRRFLIFEYRLFSVDSILRFLFTNLNIDTTYYSKKVVLERPWNRSDWALWASTFFPLLAISCFILFCKTLLV
jgi:hypothetical protein